MTNTFEAYVVYFDENRGEGMLKGLNGEGTYSVYACNIPGRRTWFPETACVYYGVGQVIDVHIDDNGFCIPTTPGIFDAKKWSSLDQDRLAFKCDETGKATNGLFGKGAGLW